MMSKESNSIEHASPAETTLPSPFITLVDIKEEFGISDDTRNRFCTLCSESGMSLSELKDHLALHVFEDPLTVKKDSTEDITIYPKFNTVKHITYRSKTIGSYSKVYSCAYCGRFTIYLSDVARHVNKECAQILKSNNNLLVKHTMDCIECNDCRRKYSDHGEYVQHLKTHASKTKNRPTVNTHEKTSEYKFICVTCGKAYLTLSSLETHMVCHPVEPAKCKCCDKVFKNEVMLNTHMMIHTEEHPFPCHVCGCRFVLETSRTEHIKQAHGKSFPCKYCDQILTSKLRQIIHQDGHFKNKSKRSVSHLCSECGKIFTWKSNLTTHEKHVHRKDTRVHMCSVCGKILKTATSLRYHMANHKGIEEYICDVCGLGFCTPRNLRTHMYCHSDLRPFACKVCNSTFKHFRNLQHHRKKVHGIIPGVGKVRDTNSCTVCNKTFASLEFLMDHMRTHNNEQPFKCKVCDKKFSHYQGLFQHLRTGHMQVPSVDEKVVKKVTKKEFKCSLCEETFDKRIILRAHRLAKHGQVPEDTVSQSRYHKVAKHGQHSEDTVSEPRQLREPIECKHCAKLFISKQSFISHTTTEHDVMGENLFACKYPQCNKCYKNLLGLRQHVKKHHKGIRGQKYQCHVCKKMFTSKAGHDFHIGIHTGQKPFTCEICGKSFRLKSSLVSHALTHTDLKPVTCDVCGKHFRKRSHLVTHMRTHTGEKPYSCNVCGRAFAQSGDRNKHRINMHKDVHSSSIN